MNATLSKDIVIEWGLDSFSEEKRVELVERIGRILYQAILVRSLDILSEKDQEEFDELLDQDSTTPDTVLGFLQSRIPTFDQLIKEERKQLKEDLILSNK